MKILLVGPAPPPHGGISVHVVELKRQLEAIGMDCRILNLNRRVPAAGEHLPVRNGLQYLRSLWSHAQQGWLLHFHNSGHGVKGWLLCLACGLAGCLGPGAVLTLHSGMLPDYLNDFRPWRRWLARVTCGLYGRVICVSSEIARSLAAVGVSPSRLQVIPAFVPAQRSAELPPAIERHIGCWRPWISTALFFRPEYGFELLIAAVAELKKDYPSLGCLVLGGGEQMQRAQEAVAAWGVEDHVHLAGDVPHAVALAAIARSHVFVRPTLKDGDANSVREAVSQGVPVVASRVGVRPPGVVLFEPGSTEDLIAKLRLTLRSPRQSACSEPRASQQWNWRDEMVRVYGGAMRRDPVLLPQTAARPARP